MGLDSSLIMKKYLVKEDEIEPLTLVIKDKDKDKDKELKLEPKEIIYNVAYWRKANQIHNWFVKNIQKGIDDCKEYYVSVENLEILLNIINIILGESKNNRENILTGLDWKKTAKELLPTTQGFFFGGTDYDEHYLEDLRYTKRILDTILNNPLEGVISFYYDSSW